MQVHNLKPYLSDNYTGAVFLCRKRLILIIRSRTEIPTITSDDVIIVSVSLRPTKLFIEIGMIVMPTIATIVPVTSAGNKLAAYA